MNCPNNPDCDIQFTCETNDSGDASTPYFSSWVVWLYSDNESTHVPECPPLTQDQIDILEDERNKEPPDYSWMEP